MASKHEHGSMRLLLPAVAQVSVMAVLAVTGPTPHVRQVSMVAAGLIAVCLLLGLASAISHRLAALGSLTALIASVGWLLASETLIVHGPPESSESPILWTAAVVPLVIASGYAVLRLDQARVLAGLTATAWLLAYAATTAGAGLAVDNPIVLPGLVLAAGGAMIALAVDAVADAARQAAQAAQAATDEARWAYLDPLTGIANRRGGEEALAELGEHGGAVLLVDLDHFKSINDDHGHATGDVVLTQTGGRIAAVLRDGDTPIRWGGEEFVVVLPRTDRDGALTVARRVHEGIGRITQPVPVTASLGVALCAPGGDVEDAIQRADDALYRAKATGRNRVALDEWFGPLPEAPRAAATARADDESDRREHPDEPAIAT